MRQHRPAGSGPVGKCWRQGHVADIRRPGPLHSAHALRAAKVAAFPSPKMPPPTKTFKPPWNSYGATTVNNLVRKRIISLAMRYRLPAVYPFRPYAVEGGLISYGFDPLDLFRRGASYVDRILRGEKPSDLPVQAPTKFELIINLKTAKALNVIIPSTLVAIANEVIE